MSDGPILQVERWPHRKRKVLSKVEDNTTTVLAIFVSDEAAAMFLDMINCSLRSAYQLGKNASATIGDAKPAPRSESRR